MSPPMLRTINPTTSHTTKPKAPLFRRCAEWSEAQRGPVAEGCAKRCSLSAYLRTASIDTSSRVEPATLSPTLALEVGGNSSSRNSFADTQTKLALKPNRVLTNIQLQHLQNTCRLIGDDESMPIFDLNFCDTIRQIEIKR